jgi:tight adherence protein C
MGTAVLGIIFIVIFLVVYRVGISFSSQEKMKKRRVMSLAETDEGLAEVQSSYSQERSFMAAFLENLVRPFRNVDKQREDVYRKLYQAGKTSANSVSYYFFFSTYGWLLGLIFAVVMFKLGSSNQGAVKYAYYFLAILLGIGFTFGAKMMLDSARQKRQEVLTKSFPDSLDLLLICVESGLALDASLARVCKELKHVHPEITEELNRTRLELTLLNDRAKALTNLAERTDLTAFKALVAALLQSEKFGTSLVGTLRVLSDDYRQTRMMLAEEKAAKLDPKITAVTIPFMLIALLILIMTPAAIQLKSNWKPSKQQQSSR